MNPTIATVRWWQAVVIIGCVGVGVASSVALAVLTTRPELYLANVTAYSVGYLVAGSLAWIRRPANPVGPVMLAISVAGGLSFFTLHPDPIVARPAGFSGSLANVLVVWVMLAAPAGRLEAGMGRWALAAFAGVLLAVSVVPSLDVLRVVFAAGLGISLLLAGIVLRRWTAARGASRRALTPVVVAGVVISLVHAVDFGAGVLLVPVLPGSPIYWMDVISRMLVPFGFLLGLLRLRMARAAVADLVIELGESPPPGRMRAALASALHDPTLAVLLWSPAEGEFVDDTGSPVDPERSGDDRAVVYLEHGGQRLAAILHDPALSEDPGLVAAVGAAFRLAVDNERLTAEVRAQLEEVRASRSRIVQASDAERRRVERNLHDGAQQRLVALSLALRRAQAQLPPDAAPEAVATLETASEQLASALAELRTLARGIHPAILTEAGLEPALRSLARESPIPVDLRLELPADLPDGASAAAYFVVSEALANVAKYADARHVDLTATSEGDELRIEVRDDGIGGADPATGSGLRGLADRVAALGGRFEVFSPLGEGTRIVALVPLVSAASGLI